MQDSQTLVARISQFLATLLIVFEFST